MARTASKNAVTRSPVAVGLRLIVGGYLDAEGGGMLSCVDQSVETQGAWDASAREQKAMPDAAIRLGEIPVSIRAATPS
jgi:hypothetical protein